MDPSPTVREASLRLDSGIHLHYAEAGAGHEQVLVLLHGYTDSWRSFELVLPLLARLHHVIALDLRGHGGSSAPEQGYGTSQLAQDVAEFLDKFNLPAVTLVGHSMGSFVARRVAIDFPARIQSLVLVGTALTGDNCNVRGLRRGIEGFTQSIPDQFIKAFQASCVAHPQLMPEHFFRTCCAATARVPVHVWRAALNGMLDADQSYRLGAIACPTLIVGGRQDSVFSVCEQEEVARAISGARIRLYRHAGHSPHWEEPGRFAEDVQQFLEEVHHL